MAPPSQAGAAKREKELREARRAKDNTDENSGRHDDNRGGISGAGRGNFAPDRPRGQSSNSQAHSARHGINKSRAAVAEEKPTPHEIVHDLVDTPSGDGPEDTFLVNAKNDELWGLIRRPEDGARVVRLVQEQFSVDRVIIRASPHRPDRIAAAKMSQAPVKITSSDGTVRFSTNHPEYRPPQASQTTHVSENPNVQCSLCDSTGHTLNNCLTSNESGFVGACIFCNSSSHWTDGCAQFAKLSLSGKVNVLVTERAGKPPLATVKSWWDYLLLWYISDETKDEQAPTDFPWRQEFAARVNRGDMGKSVKDFQSEFNQHGSSASPVDNEMQTLSDVFYRYWEGKGTPVPSRVQAQISRAPLNS